MNNLILIKLGGSIITDKKREYVFKDENMARFAGEIKQALSLSNTRLIVGHGAGSFAHIPASIYRTKEGIVNKDSIYGASVTEEAARHLNGLVIKKFVEKKIPAFPFSPGSYIFSDSKVYSKSYIDPIKNALKIGLMPVVYGDVILDRKIGFTIFSTEKVFEILVNELKRVYKIKMIFVTDVDGVYDKNGKTIPEITEINFESLKAQISGAKGVDVTGGMLHKVEEALKISSDYGITTFIINGNKKGNLMKVLLGKKVQGTKVFRQNRYRS